MDQAPQKSSKRIVVTIDGLSACGKSSLAKQLAHNLNFKFLNSGLLYRAIGIFLRENNINTEEEARRVLDGQSFILAEKNGEIIVVHNGSLFERDFFTPDASADASRYAEWKSVRDCLMDSQKNAFISEPLIAEGRDMGSVVFPDATIKVFVEVPAEERAKRRMVQTNNSQSYESVLLEINERDQRDAKRTHSPTAKPEGAIQFENHGITFEEAVKKLTEIVLQKLK